MAESRTVLADHDAAGGSDDITVIAIVPVPIRNGPRGGIRAYALPCGGCDHMIEVPARTFRDLRSAGRQPLCDTCKRPAAVLVTEAHVRYWVDRFPEREIRAMGDALDAAAEGLFGSRIRLPLTVGARDMLSLSAAAVSTTG